MGSDLRSDDQQAEPIAEPAAEVVAGPVGRRAVVTGAGVVAAAVVLGGCATYGGKPAAPPPSAPAAGGAAAPLAKAADIPVGGGKIFKEQAVVVTQATAGKFAAFSTVCTHQGCDVNEVAGGTINCPCHGSKYKLDGTVADGPAPSPLAKKNVTVQGDSITLA